MIKKPRISTILATDDEPEVPKFVCRVLELEGFAVLQAEDGEAGIRTLISSAQRQISLVLLDIMMPDMDGFTLCRRIRESSFLPPQPRSGLRQAHRRRSRAQGV